MDGTFRPAYLEDHAFLDHAFLLEALLALYEATFAVRWFIETRRLADVILDAPPIPPGVGSSHRRRPRAADRPAHGR